MKAIVLKNGNFYEARGSNTGKGYNFILMSLPTAIHIITAALNIKDGDPSRGAKALVVATASGTSTFVIIPIGTITALLAAITAFNNAIGAQKKAKWRIVKTSLKSIMRTFQNAMDLAPADAAAICASGGFKVKNVAIKQKNVFGLFQDTTSGSFHCTGDVLNSECLHEWTLSSNGTTFIMQRATKNAFKEFSGLAPGRYWVTHQCIMDNGKNGVMRTLYIDLI